MPWYHDATQLRESYDAFCEGTSLGLLSVDLRPDQASKLNAWRNLLDFFRADRHFVQRGMRKSLANYRTGLVAGVDVCFRTGPVNPVNLRQFVDGEKRRIGR